ncbi:cyclin-dependent kinase inhibitor 5-like [Dorcoceras hygrometricum]|uniref:Cyclin-dependent kinase inhibitor 5-like n=1 Tax=Dorcoceras hygrometricum TaxID=472368 RepID=A0A2Z7CNC8_9LAMI|nr:cyclin-dependent kinase inhibitor 5-like [Dorcoceras hygrometricum]
MLLSDYSTAVRSAVGFFSHNTSRNSWFTFIAIAGKRCSRLVVQTLVLKPALQLLYRSSSNLRLFSASVPAGPFAPADLSSSAEHDVVTDYIITNPSADLAILLVDLLNTMTSLMTLSSLVPDSLELAADS